MNFLQPKNYNLKTTRKGQSALSMTLVIGGIIIFIGVSLAILAISFLNSTFGFQTANRAQAIAMSGISDAMFKLIRDKNYNTDYYPYCVPGECGANSAVVTVAQNSETGRATILSTAALLNYKKQLQAIVSIDQRTGLVTLLSLTSL